MTVFEGAPAVSAEELRALVAEPKVLQKAVAEIFDRGSVLRPSRCQGKLFADVNGSKGELYRVTLDLGEGLRALKASCTCKAAMQMPVCKHAVGLLVAWSRAPESFAVSDVVPLPDGHVKVREGETHAPDRMRSGVEQVCTLVRELGTAGVAAIGHDRIAQIQKLGESLGEGNLRRLSARTIELARLLGGSGQSPAQLDPMRYAELMTDLLLTARKLEKHLGGEPLEDRHVEALIGEAWTPADRRPVAGLRLVEVAFLTRKTPDGSMIRESRLIDLASGAQYSEQRTLPASDVNKGEPKHSYATSVLEGAGGSVYPGFPPQRLALTELGKERPLDEDAVKDLVERALPDVGLALASLQEHRKDVFAPDCLPVAVRVDTLLARGSRMEAVDAQGHALHLPDDPALEERLATVLREGRLLALIGDVGIDAALPTLWPLAAVIEGSLGAELRPLHDPAPPLFAIVEGPLGIELKPLHDADVARQGEAGVANPRAHKGSSSWAAVARAAGASSIAITLGEAREELADCFVSGLAGLNPKVVGSIAARLRDLHLDPLAARLDDLVKKADPEERLRDFIKVYQGLGMALLRLAGAVQVDRAHLTRVPTYESVCVRRPESVLPPDEIRRAREQGALNRYEAAVQYAQYYERLSPDELTAHIYPTWADGSVGPYVARAFAGRGPEAVAAAERALAANAGRVSKITAVRVLQAASGLRAQEALHRIVHTEEDRAIRAIAEEALDAIDLRSGFKESVRRRRAASVYKLGEGIKRLLREKRKEQRQTAVEELVELGHRGALYALRQAFMSDQAHCVREASAYALAQLGDTEMVETFVRMFAAARRGEPVKAEIAARALGILGDVRGLGELLAAYAEGYMPAMIADAIKAFGPAAMGPLLDLIESRPELARARAAMNVLEHLPAEDLGEHLARRLRAKAAADIERDPAGVTERANLYLRIADVQAKSRRLVAKAICEVLGSSEGKAEAMLVKISRKALEPR